MADQAKAVADPKDQTEKIKLVVDGQEVEVTKEEAIKLAQMGKDYTNKTKALADEKKSLEAQKEKVKGLESIIDEMNTNPDLSKALNKVYSDFKSGKISKSDETKDKNLSKLDSLIEKAKDADERESLKDIRTIISEETNIGGLQKKVELLEEELKSLKGLSSIGLTQKIDSDLQKLEDDLGKDFVDKYRKEVTSLALKYPNQSVKKLLYHMASDDEALEDALIQRKERRKKEELERKKKGSSPSGTEDITTEIKFKKDKAGRVPLSELVRAAKEKLGKS